VFRIERLGETGSTNDDAQRLLGEPGGAGLAIVADYQHAGRGRRAARAWIAPPGCGLLFTTILPEVMHVRGLHALPFWVALAVADAIEDAAGLRVDLQWPNDLLLGGAKVAGILCISRISGDDAWVGCGVGVNVHRPHGERALAVIAPPPAFLDDAAAHASRDVLLAATLAAYERRLHELARPEALARAWERRAGLEGTPYRLHVDGEAAPFDAVARRIAPDGGLVVVRDGRERTIALADARVLRD